MRSDIYYDFEDFRLDVANEQLSKDNEPIPLTHKAFKTLLILVQNSGKLVKKEDIIDSIWHDSFVEDANLTQQIYVLRKTLGNNKDGKPFIETIPKRGYCFVAEIQKIRSPQVIVVESGFSSQLSPDDGVLDEQYLFVSGEDGLIHQSGNRRRSENTSDRSLPLNVMTRRDFLTRRVWMSIGIMSVLVLSFFLYQTFWPVKSTGISSIAVLPFRSIGSDVDNEKFGFGIADAVITSLSRQQEIPVRPTSAIFQFTDKNFNSIDAGRELGVDSVLEGAVQRDAEMVRVSVHLIKISDGSTVWSEKFDEKYTDIFALQDAISTKLAKSLTLNLSKAEEAQLTVRNTSNPEAYQAYQLGRYFWNKRTEEDLEKAANYFQTAIELDGKYAIAHAMLADTYNMLYYYGFTDGKSNEVIDKADQAARTALLLNDSIPESHIAMSFVQMAKYDDMDTAVHSLERAIELSPYNPTARIRYGWQLLRRTDTEGAYSQMRIAQENDPLSVVSNSALCSILLLRHSYSEALKYCQKSFEIQPDMHVIKVQLASVHFLNGRTEKALAILEGETQNETIKYDALAGLAYIYAKTGRMSDAEEIYDRLKANKQASRKYGDLVLIGYVIGKKEEALGFFKEIISRNKKAPFAMISDPYWEEILKDEDFRKLIPPDNGI